MKRLFLALLVAAPVAASAGEVSVRLRQPLDAAALRGGSTAVIAWSADTIGPGVEEWEAFLSVDGGRYYGARITPHLDISIREFHWTVPNVDTRNARILLRFGNERHEIAVDLPQRLSIESSRSTVQLRGTASRQAGEPARPGDPGVALWVDSDRRGGHLRPFAAETDAIRAAWKTQRQDDESESTTTFSLRAVSGTGVAPHTAAVSPARRSPPLPSDVLLRSCRLNI